MDGILIISARQLIVYYEYEFILNLSRKPIKCFFIYLYLSEYPYVYFFMMPLRSIIQWNCCGYRANYQDIQGILRNYKPSCLCLEGTVLGDAHAEYFTQRIQYAQTLSRQYCIPGDGVAPLIRRDIASIPMQIITRLLVLVTHAE